MAMINGTKVVAVRDSLKGFYSVGMVGVIEDFRDIDGGEYLVDFEGRDKKVWTNKASLIPVSIFSNGDRVIAIRDSIKGLYTEGMIGTVQDFRPVDSGEYLVKFDDKTKKIWTSGENIRYYSEVEELTDDECDCKYGILVGDLGDLDLLNVKAGSKVKIIEDNFGYYGVISKDGIEYDVEKQNVFVIPENKPFYIHVKDLRKLRELGCEFGNDSGLYYKEEPFIAPNLLDIIDKSFVAEYNDENQKVTFMYKGVEYNIADWELSIGLIELRD